MAETSFLLGMGQILVEDGDPRGNLERARAAVQAAAERSCSIVVLPECLDLGWTSESAPALAQPIPGPHSDVIASAAREFGVYVAAGLTERAGERLYNSAVLVSPEGEILLKHRKINELTIAHYLYSLGTSLGVVETPLGIIGLNICADNFPDSLALGHALGRMGCQLLVSPSAWAVDADHDNVREPYGELWKTSYCALSSLYDMTIAGVSDVGWVRSGPWRGRKCIGCSLAVGPGGRILAQAPYGEAAECLEVVEVHLCPSIAKGTDMAPALAARGYLGPL